MTLSKFTISAIVHLHTVGLKGFVTLLGEKGFPPPNGLELSASLQSVGQRVSEAYSRLEISASDGNGVTPTLVLCSRNARPQKGLVRRAQWDQHGCHSKGKR